MDIDNILGYWIKDIPYIWIGDKEISKCYRLYLSPSTITFDSNFNITNSTYSKDHTIIPLYGQCNIVKNFFLSYYIRDLSLMKKIPQNLNIKKYEIRVRGVESDPQILDINKVDVYLGVSDKIKSFKLWD